MRVVVPYVRLEPEVYDALISERIHAAYVRTEAPDGYWTLLRDLWKQQGSFIVLEQDKVPAHGLLDELWGCPNPWCTVPVPMRGTDRCADYPTLSCTKFGAELMKSDPHVMDDVGEIDLGDGPREWSRLDLAIAGRLSPWDPHWHEGGRVQHLHRAEPAPLSR